MQDYVYYFSKNDLTLGHYLDLAEKRIQDVSEDYIPTSLNNAIELWHIREMVEEGCQLSNWSDGHLSDLRKRTASYNSIVARFFSGLRKEDICSKFETLVWPYKKNFFQIIDAFKMYHIIEPETLRIIIESNINHLYNVLSIQRFVEKYKVVIREVMMTHSYGAFILLKAYVSKRDPNDEVINIPSNLTLEDKEQIIINYLNCEDPNINYVRLITQTKDDNRFFSLSPKTRLAAEKLAQKLNEEILSDPRTVTTRRTIGVQFKDDVSCYPKEIFINEEGMPTYIYSVPYILEGDSLQRVYNCITLFGWMNNCFLVNLINKRTEVETIEPFLVDKGRDSYPSYAKFHEKNNVALYQLYGYEKVLKNAGSSFEKELKYFYEHYLKSEYEYPGLPINLPEGDDTYLNKCRILCPELDAVVKQYNLFVEDGNIDGDLIRLSKPCKVEDGNSILKKKYCMIDKNNNEIWSVLRNLFHSSISMLQFVDPYKDKNYQSFIDLLEKGNKVLYNNYANYQKPYVDFLQKNGLIDVDEEGALYIVNRKKIAILRCLWEYDVCPYWYFGKDGNQILDEMLEKGWLVTDNHLLSEPERDYFSFFLDNMKFTNGTAYRNHYMHGSSAPLDDENEHAKAYWIILRLFTILLLKIDNDLWLNKIVKGKTYH